jgi:transcriptional regulator with GAF, ATPase, and Fis domain
VDNDREARATVRRELRWQDLANLAETLAGAYEPADIYRALEHLSADVIGHRLFTVMRADPDRGEVERVYTTMPAVYPVGGRKQKAQTAWADQVLGQGMVFRVCQPKDIRAAFDDSDTIIGLGLGSILNVPVVFKQQCVGTMNLLHAADWYRGEDEAIGRLLATFLLPVLLDGEKVRDA